MGTLWLGGGQRGWFARNFTQITGADTGFHEGGGGEDIPQAPPPWTLSAWRHPPSEKLKNTPTLGHSPPAPPPRLTPMHLLDKDLILGVCYRPPSGDVDTFIYTITKIFHTLRFMIVIYIWEEISISISLRNPKIPRLINTLICWFHMVWYHWYLNL